ncbi:hypothetical protein [Shewanella fodinae]|uniref:hypothetical protein n=1 Tax=Shewanella fodinae TaxID=552357 RepID=UPI001054D45B|nr:hypothetical protein [Shewanella fodinae]
MPTGAAKIYHCMIATCGCESRGTTRSTPEDKGARRLRPLIDPPAAPRRKTLRAYGLPFSQIAANSESIPRRGFFGIHASIAQWLPNAPTLRQGELVMPSI